MINLGIQVYLFVYIKTDLLQNSENYLVPHCILTENSLRESI